MTRSEVSKRIEELRQLIEHTKNTAVDPANTLAVRARDLTLTLLTAHKMDLQQIFYAHLYKLP